MKKVVLTFVVSFIVGFVGYANYLTYIASESPTFKPTFAIDYTDCGEISFPSSEGSVQFGDASTSCGGRVVSNEGYVNISQIRFTADLSNVSGNFVTSTFYMVNNPNNPSQQPLGDDYCDDGAYAVTNPDTGETYPVYLNCAEFNNDEGDCDTLERNNSTPSVSSGKIKTER